MTNDKTVSLNTIKGIIILLGETNDEQGNLSQIAQARCKKAIKEYFKENQSFSILPTGAFGKHFNITNKPHGQYLTEYLLSQDIPSEHVLPFTHSSNTVEDAFFARKAVAEMGVKNIIVVTSDVHMERVKFIFGRVFAGFKLEFSSSENLEEKERLRQEQKSLKQIQKEWLDIPLELKEFPTKIYENANSEHKHYDTISLAIVSGIIFSFGIPYTVNFEDSPIGKPLIFMISALLILCLLLMYIRAAHFARTARLLMKFIELSYGIRGFSSIYPMRPLHRLIKKAQWFSIVIFVSIFFILVQVIIAYISAIDP